MFGINPYWIFISRDHLSIYFLVFFNSQCTAVLPILRICENDRGDIGKVRKGHWGGQVLPSSVGNQILGSFGINDKSAYRIMNCPSCVFIFCVCIIGVLELFVHSAPKRACNHGRFIFYIYELLPAISDGFVLMGLSQVRTVLF